jgi:hypothetical protein
LELGELRLQVLLCSLPNPKVNRLQAGLFEV